MEVNNYLKCEICGSVLCLHVQNEWLKENPARIHCGKCGISIHAVYDPATKTLNCKNAFPIKETQYDYHMEISGGFPCNKLTTAQNADELTINEESARLSQTDQIFKQLIEVFSQRAKDSWPKYQCIFELWENGGNYFAMREIHKLLPRNQYPANNDLEILRAIHALYNRNISFLFSPLEKREALAVSKAILDAVNQIESKKLQYFIVYFEKENHLFHNYQLKIFQITKQFTEKFNYFIPAFYTLYQKSINPKFQIGSLGTSTCTFKDIQSFYLSAAECALDLLPALLALNNLKYRDNFNKVAVKDPNIKSLVELLSYAKGKSLAYIEQTEFFTALTDLNLDLLLYEAMRKNRYTYDSASQIITYTATIKNNTETNTICLLDFAAQCIHLMRFIVTFEELLYQIHKISFVMDGNAPQVNPKTLFREPERNEKCPCGSGLKYKKCHGRFK